MKSLIALLAVLCLSVALTGCKSFGSSGEGMPVVASINVLDPGGLQLMGTARYDGNKFVAWGIGNAQGELWMKANGFPLLGPAVWHERVVVFESRDPEISWKGDLTAPLPAEARELFRPSEIAAYAIQFEGYGGPGDTVPTPAP